MAEQMPSVQSPILLQSERLKVEVARPGSAYTGTRFDWTAFITQVTLDRKHTFCVPESVQPGQGTGGIGLCNEFGIERAVGYDDAQPGEAFPKLGIGLLTRADDGPYRFARPHEIAHPFDIHIETLADSATFVVEPLDCRGYAARLHKRVSVSENELTIAYRLENTGRRPIATHEYCHNFVGIDGHEMGPDYRLRMPQPVAFEDLSAMFTRQNRPSNAAGRGVMQTAIAILKAEGNDLGLRSRPEHPFYRRLVGLAQTAQPQWELVHLPSGVGMRETDDFGPARMAVWGTTHVISAEMFVDIEVQPGETQTWTRRYTFLTGVS